MSSGTNWLTVVNQSSNHDALLKAVVALNHGRILSRIRSQHAKSRGKKPKAPLYRRLKTAKELLQNSLICSQSLASDIDNLQRHFDRLEDMDPFEVRSSRSEEHLLHLVKSIRSILMLHEQDLKRIPYTPGAWTENATDSLIDHLRKISQYVQACEELLRAARRYKIFSNIAVEFTNLQQDGRRLSVDAAFDINKTISETMFGVSGRRGKTVWESHKIKARLGERSRLHAEVQLMLYYEQNSILLRPRVICSSKSACYLCHLLFKLHGQYHIPSTHGRLYDTWKWPTPMQIHSTTSCRAVTVDLQRLLPEFNDAIDRKIKDCLNNVGQVRRINPLESRVDLLAAMTPSVLSHVSQHSRGVFSGAMHHQERDVAYGRNDNSNDGYSTTSTRTARELAPLSQTPPPPVDRSMTSRDVNVDSSIFCDETASLTRRMHASRENSASSLGEDNVVYAALQEKIAELGEQGQLLCLRKGEAASRSFDIENRLLKVHAPGFYVSVQYDAFPTHDSRLEGQMPQTQRKGVQIELECLSSSICRSGNGLRDVIDLEGGSWTEKSAPEGILFSSDGLLLKHKSTLLRLRAQVA